MISIVACCHSAKLCAYAARNFRSQQKRIWQGILPVSQRELPGLQRALKAFHIVLLKFSHCPFPLGLKLVIRLVATQCECNQDFSSWYWKDDHGSEWMYKHIPKIKYSCVKHWMTIFAVISEQRKTKRNLEYSSTTVRKYLLLEALGKLAFEVQVQSFRNLCRFDKLSIIWANKVGLYLLTFFTLRGHLSYVSERE